MRGLIAIESSQRTVGVALDLGGEVISVDVAGDPRERDLLLPAIDEVCRRAQIVAAELTAVAVSTGPGGFTGLRVAIATAKGICVACGIPAIDVPSALVATEATRAAWMAHGEGAIVALASKGERCWVAEVSATHGPVTMANEGPAGIEDLVAMAPRVVVADEHLPLAMRHWCEASGVPIVPPVFCPKACLVVARESLRRGDVVDALRLAPRYPREPEAVTVWRARKGR